MGLSDFSKQNPGGKASGPIVQQTPHQAEYQDQEYIVKEGDSLSKIALNYYGDVREWNKTLEANKDHIVDPNKIKVGQKLTIPKMKAMFKLELAEKVMNYYRRGVILMTALVFYVACSNIEEEKSSNMISGSSSKIWKEVREINAEGQKEKLTKDEKNEAIQFYSDGHFIMKSSNASNEGTWAYDKAGQSLSLTFGGANFTEYFTVVELGKSKMKLKGSDGSILLMKAGRG